MHWGAIRLSTEDLWEPPKKFKTAGLKAGYKENLEYGLETNLRPVIAIQGKK